MAGEKVASREAAGLTDATGPQCLELRSTGEARIDELAEMFRALGDHTRLRLLALLTGRKMCVCDISQLMGITQSAVSHQLRVLRGLRLVRGRREGKHVYYQLADGCVDQLVRWGLVHAREAGEEKREDGED